MYHAIFCIKYKTSGPPRSTRGLPSFYLYDEYHAYEYVITFVLLSGTGFDQSAQGLAALNDVKHHLQSDK